MTTTVSAQSSASANTKGAWVQAFTAAANTRDSILCGSLNIAGATNYLLDIGIGAAGSEVAVIDNVMMNNALANHANNPYCFPLIIQAGQRIACRVQSIAGSQWSDISFYLIPVSAGLIAGLQKCDTYGVNTADSGGTSIDPGATAYTKGAWVQLTASSLRPHSAIVIGASNQDNKTRAYSFWQIDVGLTSAKNTIIGNYVVRSHENDDAIYPFVSMPFPVSIPAGTEIWVRASCNINDATDRLLDVALYCFG